MIKNVPKKDWWFCKRCDKIIKDCYPLTIKAKKYCAISDRDSCPRFLLTKYEK